MGKNRSNETMTETTSAQTSGFILRPMLAEHLERVLEIEKSSFAEPYSREIFEDELVLDVAHIQLLQIGETIAGFVDYWLVRNEIHLINIAVDPVFRKRGMGAFLMHHLEEVGERNKVEKIFLDVRKSNLEAIQLYEKFGYKTVRIRKKYYPDNQEDALVMVKELL